MNTYGEFWVYDKSGVLANEFTVTDQLAGMAVSEVVVTEGIVLGSSDATDAAVRAEKSAQEAKKFRDETLSGKFTNDELILASGKAYEMKLKAVPTGFEIWV